MSQQQQEGPQEQQEPMKYGDLVYIKGELADKKAESLMLGPTQKGGTASPMQSAAAQNEAAGHNDANVPGEGSSKITEALGGQVVGQNSKQRSPSHRREEQTGNLEQGKGGGGGITIGEALEASGVTAGDKPVEWSDAAAIQAAEVRATGRTNIIPGGVAAAAQAAATHNSRVTRDEDKKRLADIVSGATSKLPADKPATRRDAEGVTGAEMRNDPFLTTHPAGVAASVAAAARLNQLK